MEVKIQPALKQHKLSLFFLILYLIFQVFIENLQVSDEHDVWYFSFKNFIVSCLFSVIFVVFCEHKHYVEDKAVKV